MFFQSYLLTVLPTYLPQFLYVKAGQQNAKIIDYRYDLYCEKRMDDWILCLSTQNYCPGYQ